MNFIYPLIGIIIGILLVGVETPLWTGIVLIFIAIGLYFVLLKQNNNPLKSLNIYRFSYIWIITFFTGIGIIETFSFKPININPHIIKETRGLKGIVKEVTHPAAGEKLTLNIFGISDKNENFHSVRNLNIIAFTDGCDALPGDTVICYSKEGIKKFNNVENFNPKNIKYYINIKSENIIIKESKNSFLSFVTKTRDYIEIKIEKSSLERGTAELIISLLLGDRGFLSPDVKANFENAGISHILAVSGMHIAILTSFLLFILFPLKLIGRTKTYYFLIVIFIWSYTILTGMSMSTIRAAIMMSLLTFALLLQRKNASLNALLCAATIILLFDPYALYDIGLQLSFVCVGSIILFVRPLNFVDQHHHPFLHKSVSVILTSIITMFGTWTLISMYFKKLPVLFIPSNIIILPILPIFFSLSLIFTIFLLIGYDLIFVAKILDFLYNIIFSLCDYISNLYFSTINYQVSPVSSIIWIAGLITLSLFFLKKKNKIFLYGSLVLFSFSILINPIVEEPDNLKLTIHKNYNKIEMSVSDKYTSIKKEFGRYTVSSLSHLNCDILSIDLPLKKIQSLEYNKFNNSHKKIVIIGGGAYDVSLEEIEKLFPIDCLIVHSSVRRKKERSLFNEAKEKGIKIYSLREEGSFEEFL